MIAPTIVRCNSQVKDNKIDFLVQQYEQFTILKEEFIDSGFARFNTIITSLKALDEGFSSKKYVRKFLRTLHPKWRAKVTAIETAQSTIHFGLWYSKGTGIETILYADSNHAGNYVDRKSTSGICTFMGCCLTSWFAKKQTVLAISTTEAKDISVGKAFQQALWVKQALIDYDIRLDGVLIMCDNNGAIDLSEITQQLIQMDYKRTKVYLPRIHRSRKMDEDLRESYRTLEKCLFHEGRFITPYFIKANNMLPSFQAVGLEPFLTLDEPICPRFVAEFYQSLEVKRYEEERPYIEFKLGQFTFKLDTSQLSRIFQTPKVLETFYISKWSLNSLDDHPNSRCIGPKHDLVRKNITIPRTTQT
ncbi:hypothetical protein Tco_0829479 [Tanacetum coccineum]